MTDDEKEELEKLVREAGPMNEVVMRMPADFFKRSIDESVIRDIVAEALFKNSSVVLNHVWGEFNAFRDAVENQTDDVYYAAVKLAAKAMRFAWEHRPIRQEKP